MWAGQTCCTDHLNPDHKAPNFDNLELGPNKGCDSGTVQLIAQGMCRGQTNCTIPINTQPNYTYTWFETELTPCVSNAPKVCGWGVYCQASCCFLLLPVAPSVSCSSVDALQPRSSKLPPSSTVSRCLPLSPAFYNPSKLTSQPPSKA